MLNLLLDVIAGPIILIALWPVWLLIIVAVVVTAIIIHHRKKRKNK